MEGAPGLIVTWMLRGPAEAEVGTTVRWLQEILARMPQLMTNLSWSQGPLFLWSVAKGVGLCICGKAGSGAAGDLAVSSQASAPTVGAEGRALRGTAHGPSGGPAAHVLSALACEGQNADDPPE